MDRPIRLIEILQLLGGRRSWRPVEIAHHFGISERTVYRDLQDLSRLQGIPVTRDEDGYRLVEGATIRWLGLTSTERAMLKLLLQHPAFRTASELTSPLERKLDAATRELEETPQALTLAGPERSGTIRQGLLPLLEGAVREQAPVSLLYRSLWSQRQAWRDLDPYAVFHRENTWYLVGHCHLRDEPRTFRLDRIVDAKRLAGAFDRPAFDLDKFLQRTWGVYRGRILHEATIHFDAALAPLIKQGTHHPGESVQKLKNGQLQYPSRSRTWTRSPAGLSASPAPRAPSSLPPWSNGSPRSPAVHTNGTAKPRRRRRPPPAHSADFLAWASAPMTHPPVSAT